MLTISCQLGTYYLFPQLLVQIFQGSQVFCHNSIEPEIFFIKLTRSVITMFLNWVQKHVSVTSIK